tara:strand:- start:39379 stop:41064 length:1686 start_codon:yes stop_codon:yes gene_type:complete
MKQQMATLATQYEKAYFNRFPDLGMFWGKEDIPLDRFTDNALDAVSEWEAIEDEFLLKLDQIDEKYLIDTPEHITYKLLKQSLEANKACRQCQDQLWDLDPLFGWHIKIGLIAEKQPLGSPEYRASAFRKYSGLPTLIENEIQNLSLGIKKGYTAPKPVVLRIINQIEIMLEYAIEDNPISILTTRDTDADFKKQITVLIEEKINPALQKFLSFLRSEYLDNARNSIGLSEVPNGAACYEAKIMRETTLAVTPEEIFAFGESCMSHIHAEIQSIGEKIFGTNNILEIFEKINTHAEYLFESEQAMLDYNFAALSRVKDNMEDWFDYMPRADCTIKPYPSHRAKTGAPGEYHPPSIDGSRPGTYYINTHESKKRSRADQEATLFHELIPGHHYQIALTQQDPTHHSLDQYLWNCGYGEGWALYTERLAQEMGLYTDEISILGMLSNEALRAARLVVDPGIHYMGWSRQKAVDYLKKHTAFDENILQSEVDRYIMLPGQATSYMLGQKEIFQLRDYAAQALGEKFDIRDFHHQVLKDGAVTLPMLRNNILDWVESWDEQQDEG